MNEAFLHFVWKYQIFNPQLSTTDGQPIEVLRAGRHNTDAGPDFTNTRLKIGNTTWAGNVEVHVRASQWYEHQHQDDESYSNIILHVIFENDKDIFDKNGNAIPALELKDRINDELYRKYFYYINNKNTIPCQHDIQDVNAIVMTAWMERLFVERIERKTDALQTLYKHNRNSLSETFYQVLAGNFGFKTNEQPFIMLARILPIGILGKHKNSLFQIEALMYGCAGLLNDEYQDEYATQLKQEFAFLQKKYALTTMEGHLWKFLRLRPGNFPTIRISQLAALIHQSENLFSKIVEAENEAQVKAFFDVQASAYWDDHYNFDKSSKKRIKHLGKNAIDTLVLNTVVQFLFFYSKIKGADDYRDRAIRFMLNMRPENNNIIQYWKQIGVEARNALESQALIELRNNYCQAKQCLNCAIGTQLLRTSAGD